MAASTAVSQTLPESVLPAARRYAWTPGVTVGVPGGIPLRTRIFTNMAGIDNTGATDVSAAVNAALAACPSNQVVYLPAGIYRLTNVVNIKKSHLTLRGAGIGKTTLLSYRQTGYACIEAGNSDWPPPERTNAIASGAEAGSTNLTVASPAGVVKGKMIFVTQANPDYVFSTGGYSNRQGSFHLVTATNANSITFWPPLALTLTNMPTYASYYKNLMLGIGLEDFSINLSNATVASYYSIQTWGCWVKGLEVVGSTTRQMWLNGFNMGEVRDCYTHGTRSSGPGHEGIDLYGSSSWNLVENNLAVNGGFPAIILGDGAGGCVGNVIGYNYVTEIDSGSSVAGAAFSVNHGPHNMYNLFEGNVGQMFQSDGYFGSASHNTLFRNHFSGAYPAGISWARAIDLCRWSYWFNVIGNVLGTNDRAFTYSTEINGFSGRLIYRLGYPNMGNMGYTGTNPPSSNIAALDLNVKSNVLLVANFDYATTSIVNPAADLPASLYRTNTPAWWPATASWPPIGPDLAPMVGQIPAQLRFVALMQPRPGAPSNLGIPNP